MKYVVVRDYTGKIEKVDAGISGWTVYSWSQIDWNSYVDYQFTVWGNINIGTDSYHVYQRFVTIRADLNGCSINTQWNL